MKLAVAIADAKAGPAAFVVWRGFAQSIQTAAEYGYDGVELALRTKEDFDKEEMRALLKQYGLGVSCISTGQVFADLGLYLTHPDKAKRQEAINVMTGLVELAEEFGGMVNLGRARGFIAEGESFEATTAVFLDSLSHILPVAERLGVDIVVEPVNRYETNFINNMDECAQVLSPLGSKNVGAMPDVFHMNIEDASIGGSLKKHGELVKYIHFADSNRLAPGWGHLDFGEVFDALSAIGYGGWASVEILPKPTPDEAARQAAQHIIPMIKAFNQTGQ